MTFNDTPLKKPDDRDMNPQRIEKILRLLGNDEYAKMNMIESIATLRNNVMKKIEELVGGKAGDNLYGSRVTFRGLNPREYLDYVPRFLMNFQNGDANQFNLQYMLSGVAYDELLPPSRRTTDLYISVKNDLTEMFRLMQAMRILRNSEVSEVRELYQKLLLEYKKN